jgi:hypothetical protein
MAAMSVARLSSKPVIGLLLATGAALVAAFVLAPAALLGGTYGAFRDKAALRDAVGRGLVEYWRGDRPALPALLARLVDYWFRWHAIKVVISSLLIVVFVLLAAALWRRYLHSATAHAVGAIGATSVAVVATGLLILNIQATAVPLIALLPLLAGGASSGDLTQTLREVREGLTDSAGPHASSPALPVLLGEVERYYWVMVAAAATVMVATAVASISLWRRRVTGSPRVRFMRTALSVILALTAGLLLVGVAAGAFAAMHPTGALLVALGMN